MLPELPELPESASARNVTMPLDVVIVETFPTTLLAAAIVRFPVSVVIDALGEMLLPVRPEVVSKTLPLPAA